MSGEEKQNAKQFPAKFYAKHMQAGIAKYDKETVFIDLENMKRMMPSGVGKPVYVLHVDEINMETLKEDSHGLISGSFYNELDGWLWFEFMAMDDIAFQALGNGWSISNAYLPTKSGPAGTWHNCPYDREIIDAHFTHLAIVPKITARYEGACVFTPDEFKMYQAARRQQLAELQNSKSTEGKIIMKFFKNKKEEVATVDAETMVELQNGKTVSVQEMINAMEEKKNADEEADKKKKEDDEKKNSDQKVMVNGVEMALDDLINSYCAMKNAQDDAEKKNAEDEEKEKKNAEEAEKKNALEKKKNFDELKNAHLNGKGAEVRIVETSMDKMKRGQERYGSVN